MRWETYCVQNIIQPLQPSVEKVAEFLAHLFYSRFSYSAINTARSALSSIITLGKGESVGSHPLISRIMKGIFQLKPSLPKYTTIWDVGQLLGYLESLPLSAELSLKDLSLKTATLLSILTGQRCQTLNKIDINFIQTYPDMIHILIPESLKTTRPGYHQEPLQLLVRSLHACLFLSFQKPHLPVGKDTIATMPAKSLGTLAMIYAIDEL